MNNDLISRESLKKSLKSNCDLCHDKNTNWCEHCCPLNDFEDLIDNAPTVENITVFCENADEKAIADLKEELQKIIAEKRQKGGADMRGETND